MIRRVVFLFVGVCLSAIMLPRWAYAEVIPAINSIDSYPVPPESRVYGSSVIPTTSTPWRTPEAAIADAVAHNNHPECYATSTTQEFFDGWGRRQLRIGGPNPCDVNNFYWLAETSTYWAQACEPGYTLDGSTCKKTVYSCPTTGTWSLSSDQLTCTGCWDATQVLDQNNACVSPGDKDAGPGCQNPQVPSNQPPPLFWSE